MRERLRLIKIIMSEFFSHQDTKSPATIAGQLSQGTPTSLPAIHFTIKHLIYITVMHKGINLRILSLVWMSVIMIAILNDTSNQINSAVTELLPLEGGALFCCLYHVPAYVICCVNTGFTLQLASICQHGIFNREMGHPWSRHIPRMGGKMTSLYHVLGRHGASSGPPSGQCWQHQANSVKLFSGATEAHQWCVNIGSGNGSGNGLSAIRQQVITWFCKCTPPWMFLPLDIPSEYRPEHVTFGLLCVIFKFPSRIFCRRVPGFATDCPCGVWCRGLTTCLLYVGPPLEF